MPPTPQRVYMETLNQTYGCFDRRSPIYHKVTTGTVRVAPEPLSLRLQTPSKKVLVPDEERVVHEYKLIERGFEAIQPVNSILLAKVKQVIPKLSREQEKEPSNICKLGKGEVYFKDIERIEALAKRKSKIISKEMIEKNI